MFEYGDTVEFSDAAKKQYKGNMQIVFIKDNEAEPGMFEGVLLKCPGAEYREGELRDCFTYETYVLYRKRCNLLSEKELSRCNGKIA